MHNIPDFSMLQSFYYEYLTTIVTIELLGKYVSLDFHKIRRVFTKILETRNSVSLRCINYNEVCSISSLHNLNKLSLSTTHLSHLITLSCTSLLFAQITSLLTF